MWPLPTVAVVRTTTFLIITILIVIVVVIVVVLLVVLNHGGRHDGFVFHRIHRAGTVANTSVHPEQLQGAVQYLDLGPVQYITNIGGEGG